MHTFLVAFQDQAYRLKPFLPDITTTDQFLTLLSLTLPRAAALREVCAHAVLGSHSHLVRYYSAWAEKNHMLIQNEYCNGERGLHVTINDLMHRKVFIVSCTLHNILNCDIIQSYIML